MELSDLRKAALALGHQEPISIEPDGTIWLGTDADRQYLTAAQLKTVEDKARQTLDDAALARTSARTKLAALGLNQAEVAALLGA